MTEALNHLDGHYEYSIRGGPMLDPKSKIYSGPGWMKRYTMHYIAFLCGEDCLVRYEMGIGNLQQMENQAASNLRQSFAVVGLLQETDAFYEMLTTRVAYMDTSRNLHVHGNKHQSGTERENLRCKQKFAEPSFQQKLINASPEVAALDRLYKVALEVNRFQMEELKQCRVSTLK